MEGIIKFYKREKGYGFIYDTDNTDWYFHISKSVNSNALYNLGDVVVFDGRMERGKRVAYNVAKRNIEKPQSEITKIQSVVFDDDIQKISIREYERDNRYNNRVSSNWLLYQKREVIQLIIDGFPIPQMLVMYSDLSYTLVFGNDILAAIEGFIFNEYDWHGRWYSKEGYPGLDIWDKRKLNAATLEFKIVHSDNFKSEQAKELKERYRNIMN